MATSIPPDSTHWRNASTPSPVRALTRIVMTPGLTWSMLISRRSMS
jgi:hypothetical protein